MKKMYLFAAMASIVLAGCSNKDEVKNPNELSVVAGIGSPSTRALVTGFSSTDPYNKIAVFVTGDGYAPALTTYTYDGSSWTPDAPIYLTGHQANVYGYYPATAANSGAPLSSITTITAKLFDAPVPVGGISTELSFTGAGQTDYMWASPNLASNSIPNTSNVVALTYKHALTRIAFIIKRDASYPTATGSGSITNISLTAGSAILPTAGTFVVSNGVFAADVTTLASTLQFTSATKTINLSTDGTTETACGLVAPTTTALTGIGLTMTIDGKTMTAVNFPDAPVWLSGNSYTYTVTVSPTALTVSSTVTVATWTAGTGVSNITAQ
jgi:hypothetical protein